jgi:post-segregation antitoxin (ccd killing protein)
MSTIENTTNTTWKSLYNLAKVYGIKVSQLRTKAAITEALLQNNLFQKDCNNLNPDWTLNNKVCVWLIC